MQFNRGPYARRCGVGKRPQYAINRLPAVTDWATRPGVDQRKPIFFSPEDFDHSEWKVGEPVQCFNGFNVKQVRC